MAPGIAIQEVTVRFHKHLLDRFKEKKRKNEEYKGVLISKKGTPLLHFIGCMDVLYKKGKKSRKTILANTLLI